MAKNLDWELVSSEYMFRDDWFTARRDVCRRPDGKIISPYYVLEYPDWATALALTVEGKVLLVRQYRHPIGRSVLEIPGGCVDATDAGPDAAIRRELL
ncbi:MAG TPA: NUDIX hydrolase, partial [Parasegetibacter sp.]